MNNKRKASRRKTVALVLSIMLLISSMVMGSVAWLTDKTDKVTNVFTTSGIDVEFSETQGTADGANQYKYQMIPGYTIAKNPTVTVSADSEDCYVFVVVEKANSFDNYMHYAIDAQWTLLANDGLDNADVYYMVVTDPAAAGYNILGEGSAKYNIPGDTASYVTYSWSDNQVLVKPSVTSDMMTAAETDVPSISFTVYAVQYMKNNTEHFEAAEAWANRAGAGNASLVTP